MTFARAFENAESRCSRMTLRFPLRLKTKNIASLLTDTKCGSGRAIQIASAFAFGSYASDCFAPAPVYFDIGGIALWVLLVIGYWVATPFLMMSERGRYGLFWGWAFGWGYIALMLIVAIVGKLTDGAFLAAPWFFIVPTLAAMLHDSSPKGVEKSEDESKYEPIINHLNNLDVEMLGACPSCQGQIEKTASICPFCHAFLVKDSTQRAASS